MPMPLHSGYKYDEKIFKVLSTCKILSSQKSYIKYNVYSTK